MVNALLNPFRLAAAVLALFQLLAGAPSVIVGTANLMPAEVQTAPKDSKLTVPSLSFFGATVAGNRDMTELRAAVRWTSLHHDWERYRDELDHSLLGAALASSWVQQPRNLQAILEQTTPSLVLAQDRFLHAIDPAALSSLPDDQVTADFLTWLFTTPKAITALARTIRPQDQVDRALQIWLDCWKDNPTEAETYIPLALAVAVVFDVPMQVNPDIYGMQSAAASPPPTQYVDPVERYRFYRDSAKKGILKVPLAELTPEELVWVVDAPTPTSELQWAQRNINSLSRHDWGPAYFMIRYRMDKAAADVAIYTHYTLAEIKKKGGVCSDQAYFASVTAKANGIPAMALDGEGDGGGHAWLGYEAGRDNWNLSTGRYEDHFAAGSTPDPQTHADIKEQEIAVRSNPERRTATWAMAEGYLQLADFLAEQKQPGLASVALTQAVTLAPRNLGAWNRILDSMAAQKVSVEEWKNQIGRMRVAFHQSPDMIPAIDKRESDYLAEHGDPKGTLQAMKRQVQWFLNLDNSRTDLILDSLFKAADVANTTGDPEAAGEIYRQALREKGKEIVAFKAIAPKYYDWAKSHGRGQKIVREIEAIFGYNFKEPTDDFFAMGAYMEGIGTVIDIAKQEGMNADVPHLQYKFDQIGKLQEKIAEQSKKTEQQFGPRN